jgi:hypothetical protein
LNFSALLHPEIISSKPGRNETVSKPVVLSTDLKAGELNITEGLAGT